MVEMILFAKQKQRHIHGEQNEWTPVGDGVMR